MLSESGSHVEIPQSKTRISNASKKIEIRGSSFANLVKKLIGVEENILEQIGDKVLHVKTTVEFDLMESIYDYALVSLINPNELEDWPNGEKYLQPILMTSQ